jgi:cytochrome P450
VVNLFDPALYVDGPPHDTFAGLRASEPVAWQELGDGTGCWAVLRHADVVRVARETSVFSASEGGVVLDDLPPETLAMMRNMLLAMDPPRHDDYRQPLAPSFAARVIGAMEEPVRAICGEIMADAADRGEVEFVHEVAARLPTQVIGRLMGLPAQDWDQIHAWAERNTGGADADPGDGSNPSISMAMYAIEFAACRRSEARRDDLTTLILESSYGGTPMSDIDFGSFFVQLVTAGNDTTKTMLSSGLLALLDHRHALAAMRADPGTIPGAVEEILRWANPLHYFRRTALTDTVLGGAEVKAGDKVAMVYTSANRDEAVFADSQRFDIARAPNPHLSFGIGAHFCLGSHLARLEGRVFFEELLAAFGQIELAGRPARLRSNLNNGLSSLPVSLAVSQ